MFKPVYFVWPRSEAQTATNPGAVYEVPEYVIDGRACVLLKDRVFVNLGLEDSIYDGEYLTIRQMHPMELDGTGFPRRNGLIYVAKKVYGLDDPAPYFNGRFSEISVLVEKINVAAEVRQTFVVFLSKNVYKLFLEGEFEWFKKSLSVTARAKVKLNSSSHIDLNHPGKPAIDLYI